MGFRLQASGFGLRVSGVRSQASEKGRYCPHRETRGDRPLASLPQVCVGLRPTQGDETPASSNDHVGAGALTRLAERSSAVPVIFERAPPKGPAEEGSAMKYRLIQRFAELRSARPDEGVWAYVIRRHSRAYYGVSFPVSR